MQSKFFPNLRPSPFVFLLLGLFFTQKSLAQWFLSGTWTPEKSLITYKVFHPMHDVEVDSKDLRGQVLCEDKRCHFQFKIANSSFRSAEKKETVNFLFALNPNHFQISKSQETSKNGKTKNFLLTFRSTGPGLKKNLQGNLFSMKKTFPQWI